MVIEKRAMLAYQKFRFVSKNRYINFALEGLD